MASLTVDHITKSFGYSIAEGTGRLDPSGAALPSARLAGGGRSIGVASLLPPRCRSVDTSPSQGYDKLAAAWT